MDSADQAQRIEERLLQIRIAASAAGGVPQTAHGVCLHCGAAVAAPRRWCDAGCRDDWERLAGGAE